MAPDQENRSLAFFPALISITVNLPALISWGGRTMSRSKDRRKYHGTHRIHNRPRNWTRSFREGWLDGEQQGLRRQRAAIQEGRS